MIAFRHPAFAKLSPKIARANKELAEVERYAEQNAAALSNAEWGALSAISLGIHNIYNGIEDILLSLAKDVDGLVPTGPSMHQDVLDQMVSAISGIRPAVIDLPLYEALTELKGFRHLVRHRYGFDLKADKVAENLERMKQALPKFIYAVMALENVLLEEKTGFDDGG